MSSRTFEAAGPAGDAGAGPAGRSRTIRAAFHVHSEWSYDAQLPLEKIAALFRKEHCDAVFMCEHDRGFDAERLAEYVAACAAASAAGPLLVPGIEYADPQDRVHVPVWGAPFLGEGTPTTELLRTVATHGGAAVLAHPVRRDAWRVFEREWLELSAGIEIWTRKWDGWAPNPRACRWAAEHGLVGVAALDLHRPGQMFPLAMELLLDAPGGEDPLSVAACVAALRQGRCRALIGGQPVAPLTHGGLGAAARSVERIRRPVWRRGRRVRERLHESARSADALRG
ncbi:MAG TPA: PHP domain-containing protein [Solirubrobacteraceae bacterium]|nr:PHP domain-containing protein [Solirubrobacteraceae bacterium]